MITIVMSVVVMLLMIALIPITFAVEVSPDICVPWAFDPNAENCRKMIEGLK